jgi:hypothetical protein
MIAWPPRLVMMQMYYLDSARRFHARGLAFAGNHAMSGCRCRAKIELSRAFLWMPRSRPRAPSRIAVCSSSGDILAWVQLEDVVRELYDVAFPPGVRAPAAIGFKIDEITRLISIDEG